MDFFFHFSLYEFFGCLSEDSNRLFNKVTYFSGVYLITCCIFLLSNKTVRLAVVSSKYSGAHSELGRKNLVSDCNLCWLRIGLTLILRSRVSEVPNNFFDSCRAIPLSLISDRRNFYQKNRPVINFI